MEKRDILDLYRSDIMKIEVVPCLNEGKDFVDKILK